MQTITITEIRTKSKKLVNSLKKGESVSLTHRSKVIGVIQPKYPGKTFTARDAARFIKIVKELNLPKLSYKQRERNYREHLEKKYGKGLSRH